MTVVAVAAAVRAWWRGGLSGDSAAPSVLCARCGATSDTLICARCGAAFELTLAARRWFEQRGMVQPRRCPACRRHRRKQQAGGQLMAQSSEKP